ncbi:SpoIIE family protein phosphatase [Streptomyces javensis]|uniref:SpoIIE family protein phosphatase n=1 Tax=Streptomyces javensis TaxID=114698 RepID=UPI0034085A71
MGSLETPVGVDVRDRLLATAAQDVVHALRASAATVYLVRPEPPKLMLIATAVVVSSLGVGPIEHIPVDDPVYATAAAYRSGDTTTAYSIDFLGEHPEEAISIPFPFTAFSAPVGGVGVMTAFWINGPREPTAEERRQLAEVSGRLGRELEQLAARRVPMTPPAVPRVHAAESGLAEGQGAAAIDNAPLVYHLHRLAVQLNHVSDGREAAALACARVMSAVDADAMAVTQIKGDRLVIAAAEGCSHLFLRELEGQLLISASTPEARAVAHRRQLTYAPGAALTRGRVGSGDRDDYAWVVLPLLGGSGVVVGTCSIGSEQPGISKTAPFALATLLGQALERTAADGARHALAQQLQRTLLPRVLPQCAGIRSTSRYVPTGGIDLGGDWYDLVTLADQHSVTALVGDVQGHDIQAAVVMGQLRAAVRAYATEGHHPGTILGRINRFLWESSHLMCTCACMQIDLDTGVAQLATAGHQPPIIRDPAGCYWNSNSGLDIGVPLGVDPDSSYMVTEAILEPGTLLALHTDGVISQEETQSDIMEAAIKFSGADELETLADELIRRRSNRMTDDAALLLLQFEGPPAHARIRQLEITQNDLRGAHRARSAVHGWLYEWEMGHVAEKMELLVSETVTNALIHAATDVHVCARGYSDCVRVEVRDSDVHPARQETSPLQDDDPAESGRGLLIVDALADRWGNSPSGRGKTVWFEVAAEPSCP